MLLGSTAETVARRVPCSVLTVKREDVLSARLEAELADIHQALTEGRNLLEHARYDQAMARFNECLLQDPYSAAAMEGLAAAHEHLGHASQAADLREQAALIRQELWAERPAEAVLG
jgi:Flp pilus assembly protein TadD